MKNTTNEHSKINYETALYWSSRGFNVFPTQGAGQHYKVPVSGLKWGKETTNENLRIKHWWLYNKWFCVCLNLKHSHYVVIDCDVKNKINGVLNFQKILTENGIDEAKIFQGRTPSGGRHYYFKLPKDIPYLSSSRGALPNNVEIKGNNSCVMARGTITREGLRYENDTHSLLDVRDTMELPACLISLVYKVQKEYSSKPLSLSNRYVETIIKNEIQNILNSRSGSRNNTLNKASFCIGTVLNQSNISKHEVEKMLIMASMQVGLSSDESYNTVSRSLEMGIENPRCLSKNDEEIDNHILNI